MQADLSPWPLGLLGRHLLPAEEKAQWISGLLGMLLTSRTGSRSYHR